MTFLLMRKKNFQQFFFQKSKYIGKGLLKITKMLTGKKKKKKNIENKLAW